MAGASDYLEKELLDHAFLGAAGAWTAPTTVYVALFTTATDDTGGGTEVANANAYARTAVTFDAATGTNPTTISNQLVQFPTATGSWGTVTHFAIVDSATHAGGNFLAHGTLTSPVAVNTNDMPQFAAGQLTVELA